MLYWLDNKTGEKYPCTAAHNYEQHNMARENKNPINLCTKRWSRKEEEEEEKNVEENGLLGTGDEGRVGDVKKKPWGIKLIQDENNDTQASTDGQTDGPTRRESARENTTYA